MTYLFIASELLIWILRCLCSLNGKRMCLLSYIIQREQFCFSYNFSSINLTLSVDIKTGICGIHYIFSGSFIGCWQLFHVLMSSTSRLLYCQLARLCFDTQQSCHIISSAFSIFHNLFDTSEGLAHWRFDYLFDISQSLLLLFWNSAPHILYVLRNILQFFLLKCTQVLMFSADIQHALINLVFQNDKSMPR